MRCGAGERRKRERFRWRGRSSRQLRGRILLRNQRWSFDGASSGRIREKSLNGPNKRLQMIFQRGRKGVEPVVDVDGKLQRLGGDDVFHADGNNRAPAVDGEVDLALDLVRVIGVLGKDQHHDGAGLDGIDDRLGPVRTQRDIARGDPTADAAGLEDGTDQIRRETPPAAVSVVQLGP